MLATPSALRAGRRLVVEIEQRVDVRDQRRRLATADPEQQLAARDEQLIAQLELDRKVGFGVVWSQRSYEMPARPRALSRVFSDARVRLPGASASATCMAE